MTEGKDSRPIIKIKYKTNMKKEELLKAIEKEINLIAKSDNWLIKKREELVDKLTPNGQMMDELSLLLEIERELTLREEDPR